MLSLVNIINTSTYVPNVSALDYSSNIGVGFTFNPTLSISLSSGDLVIDNLVPGSIEDSNSINVSVTTNTAYGYTLSATTNSNNLIHNDNNVGSVFNSISTNANLETLVMDNTWGYSYKLPNGNNNTWSNYNGLSTNASTTLLNADNQTSKPIAFKISAKASSTQPSGVYTGTITFVVVTKPTPMNLAESYFAHGKSRYKGYYTMQDMNTEICNDTEVIGEGSQTELIDIRDDKVYWATKLADNHCWMTQNLDLDLDSNRTYTHWDTDLGWTELDEGAEWKPEKSTINFSNDTVPGWSSNQVRPYSANPGDVYYYTSRTEENDIKYSSLQECALAGHDDCSHYHAGNYYNWPAAIASNNINNLASDNAVNSICPSNWRLAYGSNDFGNMLYRQGVINSSTSGSYGMEGFRKIRSAPLYFVRSANVDYSLTGVNTGWYWYSNLKKENIYFYAGYFCFGGKNLWLRDNYGTQRGFSVRCLAR